MIAIRFGTYTIYKNIEMSITEYYGHGLDREIEQNHRIISYPKEYGLINGFVLDESSNSFKKDILIKDLKNAFFIETKVIYKEDEFNVWAYKKETKSLIIYTTNNKLGEAHHFIKLSDRYIKEIPISEIDKIWEERIPSPFDIPMPEGIELIKVINLE